MSFKHPDEDGEMPLEGWVVIGAGVVLILFIQFWACTKPTVPTVPSIQVKGG